MVGDEAGEKPIGGVAIREAVPRQFGHQPILEGAKESLHSTLSLGREGADRLDLERLQRRPHLGRVLSSSQFLLQAPEVVGSLVDGVAVLVDAGAGTPQRPITSSSSFR